MWQEIIDMAISNGLWAAMFVGLLCFQLKDSSAREKKYQQIISELSERFNVVNDIKDEVSEIKKLVVRRHKIKVDGDEGKN